MPGYSLKPYKALGFFLCLKVSEISVSIAYIVAQNFAMFYNEASTPFSQRSMRLVYGRYLAFAGTDSFC